MKYSSSINYVQFLTIKTYIFILHFVTGIQSIVTVTVAINNNGQCRVMCFVKCLLQSQINYLYRIFCIIDYYIFNSVIKGSLNEEYNCLSETFAFFLLLFALVISSNLLISRASVLNISLGVLIFSCEQWQQFHIFYINEVTLKCQIYSNAQNLTALRFYHAAAILAKQ